MAKKKVAAHSHHQQHKDSKDNTAPTEPEPMEMKQDPSEKLQNLKSLNSLLLKETFERRQQVESLEQAKAALEADLTRFGADKLSLETELSFAIQQNAASELEKAVVCVFMETQLSEVLSHFGTLKDRWDVEVSRFREKVGELSASLDNERSISSQVTHERDSLKSDCGTLIAKASVMRENLNEMEKARRDLEERFQILTAEHGKLLEESSESSRALEVAIQEGDSLRSDLRVAGEEIDALNRKIDGLEGENKGMELEKSERQVKIKEMEKEILMLKEDVERLHKEEKKMQDMVVELGKRLEEASEKENDMSRQIEDLLEVGKVKDSSMEIVKAEKESLEKLLRSAQKELQEKEQMMEGVIREKSEIEEANYSKQNEIVELQKGVEELKKEVAKYQISYGDETEKNQALVSQINEQKEALDHVLVERDSVKKGLVEERQSGVSLRSKIAELENQIEQAKVELRKLMGEQDEVKAQKEEYLKRLEKVKKEKELVEEKLMDAQQSIKKLKGEMEIAAAKSGRALAIVRETASSMMKIEIAERGGEEDEEAYGKDMEMIKNAFEMKESMVEELMREMDNMKGCIDEEKRNKKLWSLVSSATTFVAAVFFAYLARGR